MTFHYCVSKPQTMQPSASSVSFFILWSTISILLQSAHSEPQVPCFFVFGDSLFDNGNNNNLQTSAKVNYPSYGVDFPGQMPTGRFSNGRTVVDIISDHLGFEEPSPPFASIHTMDENIILKGVNYASGSAGIRSETGQHLGVRIPLEQQLLNHQTVASKIHIILGSETPSYLKECLYMINIGGNDYMNNYFVPEHYTTSRDYTQGEYTKVLINEYSQQIQSLYEMGARKVALFALGQLGFIPYSIKDCGFLGIVCAIKRTAATIFFNVELRKLVYKLNSKITDARFTCINTDVTFPLSTLTSSRLLHLGDTCCKIKSTGTCEEGNDVCDNRNAYVFFDGIHPTEAINTRIGDRAYAMSTFLDVYPIDIRTLVQTRLDNVRAHGV